MQTAALDTRAKLKEIMQQKLRIDNVLEDRRESFESDIRKFLNTVDYKQEGYTDYTKQRDFSVRYTWGHNHDFGTFSLRGAMGDRHIDILADFVDRFGLPLDLGGKKILDVGVWTGGTSLILSALGAEVTALEEVVKYSDTVNYLADSFGLGRLECKPISLYDLNDRYEYDYVIYSGVIYHVTDPVLSLRILFNSLRDGGKLFVETFGLSTGDKKVPLVLAEGPSIHRGGNKDNMSREGWNYFVPSPVALYLWIETVGFEDIKLSGVDADKRIKGVATRYKHKDMLRAGLSKTNVP